MAVVPSIRIRVQTTPKVRIRVTPALIPLNATVEVGTVTTLPPGSPATVVNSGTESAAVLNFGLPQGAQGAPGVVQSVAAGVGIAVDSANSAVPVVRLADLGTSTRNRLINGNGAINQRGATSATNDTYAWDRHNILTQTGAVGISTLSNVANGLPSMMRVTQAQAIAQRFGNSQIFESRDCIGLRGKTVTLLGKFRNSVAAATRYALLEWTGTADVVTSDIVNSWTNGTFTAGQFFNSTTLNVLAVGVITPTSATVTDFLLTATVGSSANNLIVFIWTETAQAQNSTLDGAWELLDYDATGKTYPTEFRPYAQELALCQRFFAAFGGGGGSEIIGFGQGFSTTGAVLSILMPVIMRVTPTMSNSPAANFSVWNAGTSALALTALSWNATSMSRRIAVAIATVASGLVAGNNTSLITVVSNPTIFASAEL